MPNDDGSARVRAKIANGNFLARLEVDRSIELLRYLNQARSPLRNKTVRDLRIRVTGDDGTAFNHNSFGQ